MALTTRERVFKILDSAKEPMRNVDVANKLGLTQQATHPHFVAYQQQAGQRPALSPPAPTQPAVPDVPRSGNGAMLPDLSGTFPADVYLAVQLGGRRWRLVPDE